MKSSLPKPRPGAYVAAGALVGALLLSACSSDGGSDWLSMFRAARSAWESRDAPVGLNEAAGIPYATMGVRIAGGREQILVLATDTEGERLWISSTKIAIATSNGRIVRTAGFGTDLTGYSGRSHGPEDWTLPHPYAWTADFGDLGYFSVPVNCDVRPAGPDAITILGKRLETLRVDETCRSDRLGWSFTNTYWVSSQTGRVWRSIEHIHPKGPTLEIELLRPPLSPG